METKDYLRILKEDIHTTVMATVDEEGFPVTRVIDVMLADDKTLYFITAKGKEFYRQLMEQKFVSISGVCGGEGMSRKEASIHMKAVSIRGTVKNIGNQHLKEIFEKNPYMNAIYPKEESRRALEVFCIAKGRGEYFDLSTKPVTRVGFLVGEYMEDIYFEEHSIGESYGYHITNFCSSCRKCVAVCPQMCIDTDSIPFYIRQENCLHCGNCLEVCPVGAVKYIKQKT